MIKGHLRSTIIGDSLSRVLQFLGHQVIKVNHVGDWGTQFGMLIHHIKLQYPNLTESNTGKLFNDILASIQLTDIVKLYKESKKIFDTDPVFKELARSEVVKLQQGDLLNRKLWEWLCEMSRLEYENVYKLLKIENLVERGESFYNPKLPSLVNDLQAKGIAERSDGAMVIFLDKYKNSDNSSLPLIVQKADGGFLYATTDLAALQYRIETECAQRLIYVTDAGQAQHFHMVFDAARKANLLPGDVSVVHVPFGLVLDSEGKKISSRKESESASLKDLLEEAISISKSEFLSREQLHMSVEDLNESARIMGIGAVKYADLSMNRESNYRFSYEKMLSLQGNTAPYMLYAYVRIQGIIRKLSQRCHIDATTNTVDILSEDKRDNDNTDQDNAESFTKQFRTMIGLQSLAFTEPSELQLAKHLLRSDEVIYDVADKLYPHKVK